MAETSSRHTGCPACLDVRRYNRSYGRIFSEAIPERQTLSCDCSRGVHVCCSRLAESISWIYVDTLRLSNEMCGGGLTETDGGDYRISDCKAGRQIGRGEGLISKLLIRHSSSAPQKRGGNRASLSSGQPSFPAPALSPRQGECVTSRGPRLAGGREPLGCTHLLLSRL